MSGLGAKGRGKARGSERAKAVDVVRCRALAERGEL